MDFNLQADEMTQTNNGKFKNIKFKWKRGNDNELNKSTIQFNVYEIIYFTSFTGFSPYGSSSEGIHDK
jgi:hypothetical protein